jgi:hypothetical protein
MILVRVIVPHDRMQRFDEYWLAESRDVQRRIERGYLEFIEHDGDEEE